MFKTIYNCLILTKAKKTSNVLLTVAIGVVVITTSGRTTMLWLTEAVVCASPVSCENPTSLSSVTVDSCASTMVLPSEIV